MCPLLLGTVNDKLIFSMQLSLNLLALLYLKFSINRRYFRARTYWTHFEELPLHLLLTYLFINVMSAPQNGSSQQQPHPHLPHQNTVCAVPSPSWQEESPGNEQKACVDAEA